LKKKSFIVYSSYQRYQKIPEWSDSKLAGKTTLLTCVELITDQHPDDIIKILQKHLKKETDQLPLVIKKIEQKMIL